MSKTIALSVAIKPFHALIVRYIEKDTNKRRKRSIPIRELDQAGDDPARFMKDIASQIRAKHADFLSGVDEKLICKVLLILHYSLKGESIADSVKQAEKDVQDNNNNKNKQPSSPIKKRVSFSDQPAKEYEVSKERREIIRSVLSEDEDDGAFAF
ncbi:uncharacterized protein LOC141849643 [Brevipalpus obovatus]|uniref:uncharacterized protein LOC141849643 n=1 Tax=Brevipalpus obovatus TaxID=246614 RepID=UPI003D9F44F1